MVGLVLHFRTANTTLKCLASIIGQGIHRVVLVDNSQDGGESVRRMDGGLKGLEKEGLHIDILQPTVNLGFAAGVNAGLKQLLLDDPADVLLINSDAELQNVSVQVMRTFLEDAACVVPRLARQSGAPGQSAFAFYHSLSGLIFRRSMPGTVRHPSGCCLLIRADQVRKNLFDEDFFFYGEDVMLGFELERHSMRVVDCDKAIVIHEGSGSAKNGSIFYEYHMVRAHWLLARKLSRNRFEYVLFVIARCLMLSLRASVRSLRSRSMVPWHGLLRATFDVLRGRCQSHTPGTDN